MWAFLLPFLASFLIVNLLSPQTALCVEIKDEADALIQLMNPDDPAARIAAAEWLGRTGDARFAKPLEWASGDKVPDVRRAVVRALRQLPEDVAFPALRQRIEKERKTDILTEILESISTFQTGLVDLELEGVIMSDRYWVTVRSRAVRHYAQRAPPGWEKVLSSIRWGIPDDLRDEIDRVLEITPNGPVLNQDEAASVLAGPVETKAAPAPPKTQPPPAPPVASGNSGAPSVAPAPVKQAESALVIPDLPAVPPVPEMPGAPRMRGRWLVISSAAIYSASFMELMRRASQSEVSPGWTYPIGLTVGGGTAYLLTHFSEGVPTGKAYWWASSTIWGIGASHFAANGIKEEKPHIRRLYNLAGEGMGITVGAISAYRLDWDVGDTMFVNFGGISGGMFGWGLEVMAGPGDRAAKASWLALGGSASGLAAAAMATSRVSVSSANVSHVFLGTGYGLWAGAWAPEIFKAGPAKTSRVGAAMVGASTGYFSGLITNQYMADAPTTSLRTAAWTGLGAQFGTGLGWMLFGDFDRASVTLMESFSAAGLLVGANYARIFPATRKQPGFKSWVFASAAYYGALAPLAIGGRPGRIPGPVAPPTPTPQPPPTGGKPPTPPPVGGGTTVDLSGPAQEPDEPSSRQRALGGVMMGFPVLVATTISVGNAIEVPTGGTQGLYFGEILGGVAGAGTSLMYEGNRPMLSLLMMSGSALGAATGYRMSQNLRWTYSTREEAFVSLATASGAWYGAWLPSALHARKSTERRIVGGMMTAVPATLGASLIAVNRFDLPLRSNHGMFLGEALGFSFGSGVGRLFMTDREPHTLLMLGGGAAGMLTGYEMSQRYLWNLTLREKSFAWLTTTSGAWYGGWVPTLLPKRRHGDRRSVGGIMAGTPAALGLSFFTIHHLELVPRVNHGLFMGEALGLWFGTGMGLALRENRRPFTALMLGGGALGMAGGYGFIRAMAPPSPVRGWREDLFLAYGSINGAWYGAWTGRYFRVPELRKGLRTAQPRDRVSYNRVAGAGMMGSTVGLVGALAVANRHDIRPRVLPGLFWGQVFGASMGQGAGLLSTGRTTPKLTEAKRDAIRDQIDRSYYTMASGGLAGSVGGYFFATRLVEPNPLRGGREIGFLLLNSGSAAWYGAWLPTFGQARLPDVEQRHIAGGMMMAVPTAMASSMWITNHTDLSARTIPSLFLGGLSGTSLGLGLGLTSLAAPRTSRALMLGGTAFGQSVGYFYGKYLRDPFVLSPRQGMPSIYLSTLAGAWYGFWLPTLTERDPRDVPRRRITGGALIGVPVALTTSTWVANRVDIPPRMPSGLFLGQVFGSMAGTGTVFLAEKGPRTRTSFMLAGGTLGSIGGYGFVRQMVEPSPLRGPGEKASLWLGSAAGAWYGSWLPTLLRANLNDIPQRRIVGGTMIGVPLGLTSSIWAANRYDMTGRSLGGFYGGQVWGATVGTGIGFVALAPRRATTSLMLGTGMASGIAGLLLAGGPPGPTGPAGASYPPLIAYSTMAGLWYGGWSPTFAARKFEDISQKRVTGGLMIGGPVGLATGMALAGSGVNPRAYTGFFSGELLGSMAGAGTGFLAENSYRKNTALMLSGGAVMGAAGASLLPRITPKPAQAEALRMGGLFGLGYGTVFPWVLEGTTKHVSSQQVLGGAMLGLPLGLGVTTLSFALWEPAAGTSGFVTLAGLVGSASGLGIGLTAEDWNGRNVVISMYSMGFSAMALGSRAAPQIRYTPGAKLFTTFGTLYGFGQGVALAQFGDQSPRGTLGAAILGASLGMGTSMIITYDLEVGSGTAAVAYTGGIWGGFVGSMFAQAAAGSPKNTTTAAVIASNVGQITTTYSLLKLKIPPRRMGWINLFGLTGLGVGSAMGLPLSREGDVFFLSAPIGSLIGLGTGIFVTSRMKWDETPSQPSKEKAAAPLLQNGSRRIGWRTLIPHVDAAVPQFSAIPDPDGGEDDVRYTMGVMIWYH